MALEDWPFIYHTVETENPESGFRGQFGNSYIFSAAPSAPDQRIFNLNFPVMKFFLDANDEIDDSIHEAYNMMALINFYHEHKLYKSFNYEHPIHGTLEVKFNKPLKEPEGIINGDGAVKEFSVQLVEIP